LPQGVNLAPRGEVCIASKRRWTKRKKINCQCTNVYL
jgi:hypothetical protein